MERLLGNRERVLAEEIAKKRLSLGLSRTAPSLNTAGDLARSFIAYSHARAVGDFGECSAEWSMTGPINVLLRPPIAHDVSSTQNSER